MPCSAAVLVSLRDGSDGERKRHARDQAIRASAGQVLGAATTRFIALGARTTHVAWSEQITRPFTGLGPVETASPAVVSASRTSPAFDGLPSTSLDVRDAPALARIELRCVQLDRFAGSASFTAARSSAGRCHPRSPRSAFPSKISRPHGISGGVSFASSWHRAGAWSTSSPTRLRHPRPTDRAKQTQEKPTPPRKTVGHDQPA